MVFLPYRGKSVTRGGIPIIMKKRIIVILFCLGLLFGLTAVAAQAINHISTVELSVDVPVHGEMPAKPVVSTDKVTVYAYEWYLNDNKLFYGETFEGGNTYTLKVRLSTLDEFMESVSVKVNGLNAAVKSVDNGKKGLLFVIDYYVTPLGYTLSFDPGYGSGVMAPMTGKTSYILPECTFTPPSGKEFRYWQVESISGEFRPGENVILSGNTTARAVWGTPSGRTRVYEVLATSNISSIPVLYGSIKTPEITVTKGAPAYVLSDSANLRWQKKENGVWVTQNGRFTAGEWRAETQVRIDRDAAKQYELGDPFTLKVDGVLWESKNNGEPYVYHDYSMILVCSPSYIIKDDPTVQPPKDVTNVNLAVYGYTLGASANNAGITCDQEGVSVSEVQFMEAVDSDNDGNPDGSKPAERFEAGKIYAVSFALKAKEGYDISLLDMLSVKCNNEQTFGAYDSNNEVYRGVYSLVPFDVCTVSFASGGGSGTMYSVTVEKGLYTLPQNGFTPPKDKQFKAWSVGGNHLSPGSSITLTGNVTLTAVWEDAVSVHTCKLEAVEKVAPTCTVEGKDSYYRCKDCGKLYTDAEGKNEIKDLSSWGKLELVDHADKNTDGKCDACGFAMTASTTPAETEPQTETVEATDEASVEETEKSTDAPTEATGEPSEDDSPSDSEGSLLWVFIAIPIGFVGGVLATILILRRKTKK